MITIIRPDSRAGDYLAECWRKRLVLRFFIRRDLVVRYRQTALGVGWVLIKPLLAMAIFTVVFNRIAGLPSGGVPYPLLVLTGMLPWQFLASVTGEAANSIVNNPSLVTKVYFPRLLMPASALVLNAVDLGVGLLFLVAVMTWYGVAPAPTAPLAFIPLLAVAAASFGLGLLLAALMVRYRDVRNIIPVALQFGLLASPVAFSAMAAPEPWRTLIWLNPLAGPLESLRWCLLPGYPQPPLASVIAGHAGCVLLLVVGYLLFRRWEHRFADVL